MDESTREELCSVIRSLLSGYTYHPDEIGIDIKRVRSDVDCADAYMVHIDPRGPNDYGKVNGYRGRNWLAFQVIVKRLGAAHDIDLEAMLESRPRRFKVIKNVIVKIDPGDAPHMAKRYKTRIPVLAMDGLPNAAKEPKPIAQLASGEIVIEQASKEMPYGKTFVLVETQGAMGWVEEDDLQLLNPWEASKGTVMLNAGEIVKEVFSRRSVSGERKFILAEIDNIGRVWIDETDLDLIVRVPDSKTVMRPDWDKGEITPIIQRVLKGCKMEHLELQIVLVGPLLSHFRFVECKNRADEEFAGAFSWLLIATGSKQGHELVTKDSFIAAYAIRPA